LAIQVVLVVTLLERGMLIPLLDFYATNVHIRVKYQTAAWLPTNVVHDRVAPNYLIPILATAIVVLDVSSATRRCGGIQNVNRVRFSMVLFLHPSSNYLLRVISQLESQLEVAPIGIIKDGTNDDKLARLLY
jgi:hypothetical protein